ncbi:hypothetical protein SAMN05428964_10963 [Thalassospira xiamenensis]|uniref:Uncharacterized protein n=1 Tax=Thalassospira xiamenensis TaxID=220697 RepID=A0A285TXI1_9PROT|nr:hypothetical protein SAMN05428964_10963 [Thalassospira xiamenensis]
MSFLFSDVRVVGTICEFKSSGSDASLCVVSVLSRRGQSVAVNVRLSGSLAKRASSFPVKSEVMVLGELSKDGIVEVSDDFGEFRVSEVALSKTETSPAVTDRPAAPAGFATSQKPVATTTAVHGKPIGQSVGTKPSVTTKSNNIGPRPGGLFGRSPFGLSGAGAAKPSTPETPPATVEAKNSTGGGMFATSHATSSSMLTQPQDPNPQDDGDAGDGSSRVSQASSVKLPTTKPSSHAQSGKQLPDKDEIDDEIPW